MADRKWTFQTYSFAAGTVTTHERELVTPQDTPLLRHLSKKVAAKSKELRDDMWPEFVKRHGGNS